MKCRLHTRADDEDNLPDVAAAVEATPGVGDNRNAEDLEEQLVYAGSHPGPPAGSHDHS
jgi:hypothetical protein